MTVERAIRLGDTRIETTALGFGCADLFREPSRAGRRRLLDAAFDAGIRHFDVAPMYGLGFVESELGRFARGKRDRIVIATKFGIDPTAAARLIGRVQGPIQRVVRRLPGKRGGVRPPDVDPRSGVVGRLLYRFGNYTARAARASLERSLRELQTDYVDLFFLHDPMRSAVTSGEVVNGLESARDAGRIRAWGVAGDPAPAIEAAQRLAVHIPVLQLRGDLFSRMAWQLPNDGATALILFGVIGRALARIVAHVQADQRVRRRWSDAVGVDCGDPQELARLLLREALSSNANAPVVLFSTARIDRIETAVAASRARLASDPAVDALRTLVSAELATPQHGS